MFEVKELPYEMSALEPYVSERTLSFHYGKHYPNYVNTLNKLIDGTEYENMALEDIIRATYGKPDKQGIFNNAGQVWNHEFLWNSMSPFGGAPEGKLLNKIVEQYGSYDEFRKQLKDAAVAQFGSGWAWVYEENGAIKIMTTANGDTPIARGIQPMLNIDVWEHAYYLDYQNRRAEHVENFIDHLANWPELAD